MLILVKLAAAIVGAMPLRFLYAFSDVLFQLFFYVFKYRFSVVFKNLQHSFPQKNTNEIKAIAKRFYRHFCDILLESVKGLSLPKTELQQRFIYTNPEIFDSLFEKKQSAILLGSHFGNWEWGVLSFPLAVHHKVIGIYKPLKNKKIDAYLNLLRQRWGLHLTSMKQASRAVVENRHEPCIFVLIADQTPSNIRNAHWVNFLNQDTPFLSGPEKLASRTGYPVFIFEIKKMKRGQYEVTFQLLCQSPKQVAESTVTQLFAEKLEQQIRYAPEYWLWSHRRWKRQRHKQPLN